MCACTGQHCNAKQILNMRPGCCRMPLRKPFSKSNQILASALAPAGSHHARA